MTFRRATDAAADFIATLQRAIACVSHSVIVRSRVGPAAPFSLQLAEDPVPLQGRYRLALSVAHSFALRERAGASGAWTVKSLGYSYQVHERDGAEIIAFHWHPRDPHLVVFPHLHHAGRSGPDPIDRKRHIPTGRVSLEAVVRFTIEELDVRPLRPDWRPILDDGIARFDAQRSW